MFLDETVAEADSTPDPAKDLLLDTPFQKVIRAWRKGASPSEAAVSDFLQHHEPSTSVHPNDHPWTCVGSVDCFRLRTVRGKESSATNEPDLSTRVSPRSYPAG
jgi:hypothetical protein